MSQLQFRQWRQIQNETQDLYSLFRSQRKEAKLNGDSLLYRESMVNRAKAVEKKIEKLQFEVNLFKVRAGKIEATDVPAAQAFKRKAERAEKYMHKLTLLKNKLIANTPTALGLKRWLKIEQSMTRPGRVSGFTQIVASPSASAVAIVPQKISPGSETSQTPTVQPVIKKGEIKPGNPNVNPSVNPMAEIPGSIAVEKPGSIAVEKPGSITPEKPGSIAVEKPGSIAVEKPGISPQVTGQINPAVTAATSPKVDKEPVQAATHPEIEEAPTPTPLTPVPARQGLMDIRSLVKDNKFSKAAEKYFNIDVRPLFRWGIVPRPGGIMDRWHRRQARFEILNKGHDAVLSNFQNYLLTQDKDTQVEHLNVVNEALKALDQMDNLPKRNLAGRIRYDSIYNAVMGGAMSALMNPDLSANPQAQSNTLDLLQFADTLLAKMHFSHGGVKPSQEQQFKQAADLWDMFTGGNQPMMMEGMENPALMTPESATPTPPSATVP